MNESVNEKPIIVSDLASLTKSVDGLVKENRRGNRLTLFKTMGIFGFAAIYAIGAIFVFGNDSKPGGEKGYVSVVKVQGMIADGKDASYANLAPSLKAAFEDKTSKGVVLLINSPGGTPVQSSLIHDLIVELKKKNNKKVIAVGEDMVTSGAYFIAVAADEIYVNRSTLAGSIGVISAGFGFTGIMEKLGVERRVATAGESKNSFDSFLSQKPEDLVVHQAILSSIHTHFKDVVKEGRGTRLHLDTPSLFEGQVWTGDKALEIGLVDGLGSMTTVLESKFGTDAAVYHSKKKGMESLLSDMGVMAVSHFLPELSGSQKQTPQVIY